MVSQRLNFLQKGLGTHEERVKELKEVVEHHDVQSASHEYLRPHIILSRIHGPVPPSRKSD